MNFAEQCARLGLEEYEYVELLELFIESGSADLQELISAMSDNDTAEVVRKAHKIKGAAGNLGLMEIYAAADRVEHEAGSSPPAVIDQAVKQIADQFKCIETAVHRPPA